VAGDADGDVSLLDLDGLLPTTVGVVKIDIEGGEFE
jgi:hypothetical protein